MTEDVSPSEPKKGLNCLLETVSPFHSHCLVARTIPLEEKSSKFRQICVSGCLLLTPERNPLSRVWARISDLSSIASSTCASLSFHSCSSFITVDRPRTRLWGDFQSIRVSVLQDQPGELPPGDPAGEAARLAARVLREVELFTGNAGVQATGLPQVRTYNRITAHRASLWI